MPSPSANASSLPRDAASILELAARSMFDLFAGASEGMLLVDRDARVVWINDQYRRYLPALGFPREEDFVGHPVSSVIQNTQMHQVLKTGKPILIDLLSNRAGTFVVSRIPLRDDSGEVIGALGIVLFDQTGTSMQPLVAKFAQLQQELQEAQRELAAQRSSRPASVSRATRWPASSAAARRRPRSSARRAAPRNRTARCCCWARPAPARNCWRTASTRHRYARGSPSSASTSPPCPTRCWRPSSSAPRPAPIPVPTARGATASSSWPTAARCSSTRSATCRPACRPSCCARCRRARSSRWAATSWCPSTCA